MNIIFYLNDHKVNLLISEEDSSLRFGMTGESRSNRGRSGDSQILFVFLQGFCCESLLFPFIIKKSNVIPNESDAGG
jgi:hypothetical protein